ncbi:MULTISPECIES: aminotransferase class I/II-fold pyridoxal phosphate-dependent enzyme [Paenibacillus]|uniref:Cystathionine beta-lyase family protein involved in aluminum resistance n=1 Tax=Paenibacillus pabuli TaxID=1472 RepID=A0A855Y1Y1_9BACL|nr:MULTISPECIES: methionine gamma-lyase family protein [Paenibacillus]PWW43838.1 cystathionine beta-lyase family protein involved in aluminum resistance [Paenibacillus pabuli]PXW09867.1 cystathionine beta-lyase family protein involved in aluminum resistance [Paenibacillus taichungensis]RAI89641.1 cystathionine beta-lyase family protein involved in aluminum resistance [Paenibacillus pabuli]
MASFDSEIIELQQQVERQIEGQLQQIDRITDHNQWKVINAFQRRKVSDFHFAGSTGYAYNDRGREVLDEVYADVFGAEAALVRPHFASGTHTIATALFGVLRPGDELLYITGKPYDTLHKVIGKPGDGTGSLRDFGIGYQETALLEDGGVDWAAVEKSIHAATKVIGIQRSRGYDWRSSFCIEEIADMVARVKAIKEDVIVFVDNCYGEFTEEREPTEIGVDLMAGSLIKNPGGGLAETGGYICGKEKYVQLAAYRLTAPGIGGEVGAMLGTTRGIYQGLYMAPTIVGQAIKGSIFAAAMFAASGFVTKPAWNEIRTDLIQAVQFSSAEHLIAFVQGIQRAAAVDSHVVPEPWDMPGYEHPVIMAAGTFIQGGSLELSADAPIREPYIGYMQGGLTYSHVKYGVLMALQTMKERKLL